MGTCSPSPMGNHSLIGNIFGKAISILQERKNKTSQSSEIQPWIVGHATTIAHAYHEGYRTTAPDNYELCIALASVETNPGLIYKIEELGWTIHYIDESKTMAEVIIEIRDRFTKSGVRLGLDFVGHMSFRSSINLQNHGIDVDCYYEKPIKSYQKSLSNILAKEAI